MESTKPEGISFSFDKPKELVEVKIDPLVLSEEEIQLPVSLI